MGLNIFRRVAVPVNNTVVVSLVDLFFAEFIVQPVYGRVLFISYDVRLLW